MIDTNKSRMLGGDPAERNEASYWPEHEDRPEDVWADEWAELCRKDDVRVCPEAVELGKVAVAATLARCDRDSHRHAQRQAIVRFLQQSREFRKYGDLALFAACWQCAFELEDTEQDESQTAIARQFNVTRAAVSKRVIEIRKAANPDTTNRGQKSLKARKVYALRQLIVGQSRKKINLNTAQKETAELWTA